MKREDILKMAHLNYEYMKEYLIATNAKADIRAMPKLDMALAMGLVNQSEYSGYRAKNPELKEMFFALDLIESYGSGIRRAKNAMEENGSPALVFEPSNDTDDYTMVTAYINEEYARIQAEEAEAENRQENRQETDKKPTRTQILKDRFWRC